MDKAKTQPDRSLPSTAYRDLAAFRLQLRRFLAFSEASARSEGVTSQHYQAMLVIAARNDGRLRLKDLAAEMLLSRHGAVQLIDRMVRHGLVCREPSPDDGRSVLLNLTPKGTRLFRRLAADHLAELMTHRTHLEASLDNLEKLQRGIGKTTDSDRR